MALLIILGVLVLVTFGVLGFLFFMLDKEGKKKEEVVVPLTDLSQIKRELADVAEVVSEVTPPFVPQMTEPIVPPQYVAQEDTYKKRAQELEEELVGISKKAEEQSQEARQMIEDLTRENENLRIQQANLVQAEQKLAGFKSESEHLQTENIALQTQLDSTVARMRLLEEEMTAVKLQMGEEITKANAAVSELRLEKEALVLSSNKAEDDAIKQELEELKAQQVILKQDFDALEETNGKLRSDNADLTQKVDALQYELVKARAQSTGLERIGFNYKNQLEDFFKKINELQAVNDRLSNRNALGV